MNLALLNAIRALPKVELHRHLEGALRLDTLWEFHCTQKQSLHESLEELRSRCTVPRGEAPGFMAFLARFEGLRFKYGGVEALERYAAEAVEDAAADGVAHLELRFSPVFAARRMKDIPPQSPISNPQSPIGLQALDTSVESVEEAETAAQAIVRGARRAARRCGISVAFLLCMARHAGFAVHKPGCDLLARPVGADFAGLDLAGAEAHPAGEYLSVMREWKTARRVLTVHAGEDPQGPGAAAVREAIVDFGARRIGHGVRAIEDPGVVELAARENIVLEMCPTSNVQTRACSSYESHPIRRLLEAGVRATVNTDDPAISGTTLSEEYALAMERCGLSGQQLAQCAIDAARAALLPDEQRAALVERVTQAWFNRGF